MSQKAPGSDPVGRATLCRDVGSTEQIMPHVVFDQIDLKILKELQHNARLSNVDLAKRVSLSPSPCLARVRVLENDGIISRYVALVDPVAVGLGLSVFIQVRLERQSERTLEQFEVAVGKFPEIVECYLMTGDSDYLLRVVVPNVQALEKFILNGLTKINGVANIRSSFALKQVKYDTALPLEQADGAPQRGSSLTKKGSKAPAVRNNRSLPARLSKSRLDR
jgi:Lrp/AsnC family transcriptional regulator, leucine-responsive regulatory protein